MFDQYDTLIASIHSEFLLSIYLQINTIHVIETSIFTLNQKNNVTRTTISQDI
jgi:hypothetical protein